MSCCIHSDDSPAIQVYSMHLIQLRRCVLECLLLSYLGGVQCYFLGHHALTVFCIMGVTAKGAYEKHMHQIIEMMST